MGLGFAEVTDQFFHGSGTVRDAVFDFHAQFDESLIVAVGLEYGVVAESLVAMSFACDLSFDDALEKLGVVEMEGKFRRFI